MCVSYTVGRVLCESSTLGLTPRTLGRQSCRVRYNPAGAVHVQRREFNFYLLKASAVTLLAPHLFAGTFADTQSANALYANAVVIDTLCAPFTDMDGMPSVEAVASVRQSGITAINFTVSQPSFEDTVGNIGIVENLVDHHPETFLIVRRYSDLPRAKRENKIGIMLGFQYTSFLEENVDRIESFRQLGVRIMQLTYNNRSNFGDGCLEPGNAGLSKAGIAAVKKMNDLGIAVDLSHSGYRTTSEGITQSSKPVLISHSGCAAIYAHPRNKPDEILKALADRGGYFGVYLMPYVVASPTVPTRKHVLDHVVHAINVCGADHVGIGSWRDSEDRPPFFRQSREGCESRSRRPDAAGWEVDFRR